VGALQAIAVRRQEQADGKKRGRLVAIDNWMILGDNNGIRSGKG
jgi:hypothetical protein